MAKTDNLSDFLTDVANSIRTRTRTTEQINAQDFSDKILSIQDLVSKNVTLGSISVMWGRTGVGNEHELRDLTYSNSIRINDHDYYYFATITASKMYYSGTEFPEQQLKELGVLELLYYEGSTGSTHREFTAVYMYREGNILYLTFEANKNTIKISGTPCSIAHNMLITFSDDAVLTKQTATLGTSTTYTQVAGTTLIDVQRHTPVFVPVDATKYLGYIQYYYEGDTYNDVVGFGTLA